MGKPAHVIALKRAAEVLGGSRALCDQLCVHRSELDTWLAGTEVPPTRVFLTALDIGQQRLRRLHRESEELRATSRLVVEDSKRAREHAFVVSTGVLRDALDFAMRGTGAEMGNLQLRCADGLRIVVQHGFQPPFLEFFACVSDSGSACGAALRLGRRIVVADVARDPLFVDTPAAPVLARAGVRAVQSSPLLGASGEVVGVLSTHYASPRRLTPRDEVILDAVARRTALLLRPRLGLLGPEQLRIAGR